MIEIQATEAAKRFGHLIERVMKGEEVRIIRQGRYVARVVPPDVDPCPSCGDHSGACRAHFANADTPDEPFICDSPEPGSERRGAYVSGKMVVADADPGKP